MAKDTAKLDNLRNLGRYVNDRYTEAFDDRMNTGEFDRMRDVVRQMKGKPLEDCAGEDAQDDVPDIVINVTKAVVRGVTAMVKKPFSRTNGAPFTVKPTPIPSMSKETQMRVMEDILENADVIGSAAEVDQGLADSMIEGMKEAGLVAQQKEAERKAAKMQQRVADLAAEAGLMPALYKFITNFCQQPFAVLKVEYENKLKPTWDGETVAIEDKVALVIRNINPFNFYTSPGAVCIADSTTTIERRPIRRRDLLGMMANAGTGGWQPEAIRQVVTDYPKGYSYPAESKTKDENKRDDGTYGIYDCLIMYDYISGTELQDMGVEVRDVADFYDCEVWCIGDWPIYLALNDHPLGHRPYYGTSFAVAPDTVYGDTPATDMRQMQQIINALARALVRNIALTSSIQGEVDDDRVKVEDVSDDITVIHPGQIRMVKPDRNHGKPAYTFYQIPNISGQLSELINILSSYCYEIIGIPRFAFGQTQGLGTVGRTSGGVGMLMQQAANTVYDAIGNIEADVIEPMIADIMLKVMMDDDEDPAIKGDTQVYALALSGLVEKADQSDKLGWLMQSLASAMGQTYPDGKPIIPPDAFARLLYRAFKDAGISTDGLFPEFDVLDQLKKDVSQPQSPVAQAPVDGRTGDGVSAVLDANAPV